MQSPSNITFRNLDHSAAIEDHIRQRIAELEKYHPRIVSCDVVVEAPGKKHVSGKEFSVKLTIGVPGPDIRVARNVGRSGAAEDVNLAIHKVFDAARRALKEQKRKQDPHEVKAHPPILHGTVDRLFEGEGYGFLKADDGREVYFERDSLTGGEWDDLRVDAKVRFREEFGDKGAFATNVSVVA